MFKRLWHYIKRPEEENEHPEINTSNNASDHEQQVSLVDFITALSKSRQDGSGSEEDATSDEQRVPVNLLDELESEADSEKPPSQKEKSESKDTVAELPRSQTKLYDDIHASSTPLRVPSLAASTSRGDSSPIAKKKRYKKFLRTQKKLIINPSSESEEEDEEAERPEKTDYQVEEMANGTPNFLEADQQLVQDLIAAEGRLGKEEGQTGQSNEDGAGKGPETHETKDVLGGLDENHSERETKVHKKAQLNKKRKSGHRKKMRKMRKEKAAVSEGQEKGELREAASDETPVKKEPELDQQQQQRLQQPPSLFRPITLTPTTSSPPESRQRNEEIPVNSSVYMTTRDRIFPQQTKHHFENTPPKRGEEQQLVAEDKQPRQEKKRRRIYLVPCVPPETDGKSPVGHAGGAKRPRSLAEQLRERFEAAGRNFEGFSGIPSK